MKSAVELDFTVVDKDTNVASTFIKDIKDTITLKLRIKNYSNHDKEITPSVIVTIDAHSGKKNLLKPTELFTKTLNSDKFTIGANQEIVKEINIPLENLDKIIESLESGELSLDDAIKEYENAMKLIKSSSKILNEAEGKLLKVIEKNGEIDIEEI